MMVGVDTWVILFFPPKSVVLKANKGIWTILTVWKKWSPKIIQILSTPMKVMVTEMVEVRMKRLQGCVLRLKKYLTGENQKQPEVVLKSA